MPTVAFPFEGAYLEVLGSRMHYIEAGTGEPVLFWHGNPTSSYVWRNVLSSCGSHPSRRRVRSDRDGTVRSMTFVGAGDGPPMELVLEEEHWATMGDQSRAIFSGFRSDQGPKLAMDDDLFAEITLPGGVNRGLTDEEMVFYREPWLEGSRRPIWRFNVSAPIDGEPADVALPVRSNGEWLRNTTFPILNICGTEGATSSWLRGWRADTEVLAIGPVGHYLQEDAADAIGVALAGWLADRS